MDAPKLIADFDTGDGTWSYRADVIGANGEIAESLTIVTGSGAMGAMMYFMETLSVPEIGQRMKVWRLP